MGLFNKLFRKKPSPESSEMITLDNIDYYESELSDQLSKRALRWLFDNLHTIKAEIYNFHEPDVEMDHGSQMILPNLLSEFNLDPDLGILLADGPGHSFFRVPYLKNMIIK